MAMRSRLLGHQRGLPLGQDQDSGRDVQPAAAGEVGAEHERLAEDHPVVIRRLGLGPRIVAPPLGHAGFAQPGRVEVQDVVAQRDVLVAGLDHRVEPLVELVGVVGADHVPGEADPDLQLACHLVSSPNPFSTILW
jgi:hypothetical protein